MVVKYNTVSLRHKHNLETLFIHITQCIHIVLAFISNARQLIIHLKHFFFQQKFQFFFRKFCLILFFKKKKIRNLLFTFNWPTLLFIVLFIITVHKYCRRLLFVTIQKLYCNTLFPLHLQYNYCNTIIAIQFSCNTLSTSSCNTIPLAKFQSQYTFCIVTQHLPQARPPSSL